MWSQVHKPSLFSGLTAWHVAPLSWHQGHAWCENLSLEGVYRKEDGGPWCQPFLVALEHKSSDPAVAGTVEIVVPDPCKELAPVTGQWDVLPCWCRIFLLFYHDKLWFYEWNYSSY